MDIETLRQQAVKYRDQYSSRKRIPWPEDFKKSIFAINSQGVSFLKISEATGIHHQTIRSWRRKKKPKEKKFKEISLVNVLPESIDLRWSGGLEVTGLSLEAFKDLLREGLL